MKEILKLVASLTLICVIAGASLAFVSAKTAARIEASRARQRTAKMLLVLPQETATTVEDGPEEKGVQFFRALDAQGKLVAYCAQGRDGGGFGGELKVLAGIGLDGKLLGVLVSEHAETPGIGSRVCNRTRQKSFWSLFRSHREQEGGLPPNEYLDGYTGQLLPKSGFVLGEKGGGGAIRPVSGATVSSGAILSSMNRISITWHQRLRLPKEGK